jgi:hypothetical protein
MTHNEHHHLPQAETRLCLYCCCRSGTGHAPGCRKAEVVKMSDLAVQLLRLNLTCQRAERGDEDATVLACTTCGRTTEQVMLGCYCCTLDPERFKLVGADNALETLQAYAEEHGLSALLEKGEAIIEQREETDSESDSSSDESESDEDDDS